MKNTLEYLYPYQYAFRRQVLLVVLSQQPSVYHLQPGGVLILETAQ